MKKWLIIILSIFTLNSHSQIKHSKDAFIDSEQVPTFPGKTDSIWCFLESNFNYYILNACSGKNKYVIRFRVDTTGKATDFGFVPGYPPMVYKSSCLNANDSTVRSEILRVLKMMPKWEPGYLRGKRQVGGSQYKFPPLIPILNVKTKTIEYSTIFLIVN